ncbi:hypothetical protein HWV62_34513 [Athelia sp. TMB]|nr:hypothetical protein HWV62_34513 [Athelia sp. TMB]
MPRSASFASLEAPSPLMQSPRSSLFFAKVGRAPPSPQFRPRAEVSPLRYNSQSPTRPISSYAGSSLSRDRYPPSIVSSAVPGARPWSFASSLEAPANPLEQVDEADIGSILDVYDSTASLTQQRATAGCFARALVAEPLKEEGGDDTPDPRAVSWDELSQAQAPPSGQASFMSLIWRLILFFLFFFLVQILVALSTIIDVSRGKDALTPFGTQHVALLLAAWGPGAIFGHAPGIRSKLLFWR